MTDERRLKERLSGRNIAVLCGGPSCERDVSLVSGRAVREALGAAGFETIAVDPDDSLIGRLRQAGTAVAFVALHGTYGEDGTVQRILEEAGIPYTGSGPEASRLAFDKALAQPVFERAGLDVPRRLVLGRSGPLPDPDDLEYPLVVKPAASGSSVGVRILESAAGLAEACREAFRHSDAVLLEEYVRGRELTVGILGDEALPPVEIVAGRTFYDYEAKYGSSGTRYLVPAPVGEDEDARLREAALTAHRALGCRTMSRADFILTEDGRARILEVNTIPGLTGRSLLPKAAAAAGIDFTRLCVKIVLMSLERPERPVRPAAQPTRAA